MSPPLRLKSVLLSTDSVPDPVRHAVEVAWGCEVFDHYGMTEMGLGGGVECPAHVGYHLREADLYVEIIDPATGLPVPEGIEGELVITTLTRQGMPLIRYRTGDLSRFVPSPCPCGTVLRTLARVRQRVTGAVALAGGLQLAMPDLDDALFPIDPLLGFTATIDDDNGRDWLLVEAEVLAGAQPEVESWIRAGVDSIPAIRAAGAAGDLAVTVSVRPANGVLPADFAKRKIVDLRGWSARGRHHGVVSQRGGTHETRSK